MPRITVQVSTDGQQKEGLAGAWLSGSKHPLSIIQTGSKDQRESTSFLLLSQLPFGAEKWSNWESQKHLKLSSSFIF